MADVSRAIDGVADFQALLDGADGLRAERLFRDLLESAPDAIILVDQRGQIVLVNALTEQLFGYTRKVTIRTELLIFITTRVTSFEDES